MQVYRLRKRRRERRRDLRACESTTRRAHGPRSIDCARCTANNATPNCCCECVSKIHASALSVQSDQKSFQLLLARSIQKRFFQNSDQLLLAAKFSLHMKQQWPLCPNYYVKGRTSDMAKPNQSYIVLAICHIL